MKRTLMMMMMKMSMLQESDYNYISSLVNYHRPIVICYYRNNVIRQAKEKKRIFYKLFYLVCFLCVFLDR